MLSNIHCRLNHQFRDNQKASMSLILGALGKLYNFGTKFELFSVIYFWFFAWIIFVWKNEEFWKIYFLTKFVPESIKMNLHTSSTPFWNEISISNLLILSNFWFFGLHCHRCGKHLCRFLCIRLYRVWIKKWTTYFTSLRPFLQHFLAFWQSLYTPTWQKTT